MYTNSTNTGDDGYIYISDDTAFNGYGFVTGHGTDLPRLTDIRLCGKDALERGYLVSAPDHGAEVGLEFIGFHRN